MGTVPVTLAAKLSFFEQHLPVWAADPVGIGLTAIQVSDLAGLVGDARTAFDAAQAARAASKAATTTQTNAFTSMTDLGADLIKTIRAFAETTNDPDVYAAAQIPPPADPTPAGPPDKPTNLDADILQPFGIKLTWSGSVAQNAYFGVYRQLPGESGFTLIKTTRDKSFEDQTLPAGLANVSYYIGAFRDPYQANSATITLQFGPVGATATTSLGLAA